ncbi:MAG TPA: TrkA C-terminal domain-containing protein, partial [Cytophagaceae bacterium]
GLSLSQIGEFSFIIANLGLSLNVTSSFLYPVTVAVSAITTFTTPYLIKYSGKFYSWLEKRLPDNWINSLNQYRSTTQMITTSGDWKVILRAYAYNLIIHSVIIISIIFLSTHYLNPWIQKRFADNKTGEIVTVAISLLSIAPFIWALSVRRIKEEYYSRLWQNKKLSRWPLIGMDIVRVLLGILFAGFLILQFLSSLTSILIAFGLIAVILIYFSTRLQSFYNHLEYRFLRNLNEREAMIVKKPDIVPWDAHLVELIVSPESSVIGKTLQQLAVREQYGVNIAQIRRGKHTIINPGRDEKLYPFDHILVIGTDEQLMLLKQLIEATTEIEHHETEPIVLQKIDVDNTFPLKSLSIRSSGIREDARALVVGIERDGKRILNPDSSMVFSEGDIVWVVGNPKRLQKFIQTKANAAKSH